MGSLAALRRVHTGGASHPDSASVTHYPNGTKKTRRNGQAPEHWMIALALLSIACISCRVAREAAASESYEPFRILSDVPYPLCFLQVYGQDIKQADADTSPVAASHILHRARSALKSSKYCSAK
eukprot:scaffold81489_cov42-Prasinocladus_malaysianus.AAC.2